MSKSADYFWTMELTSTAMTQTLAEVSSAMAGKRADVNIIDTSGDSLLCRVLRQRRDDLVVLLLGLQADANLEVPSLDSGSVLMLTIQNGPRDFVIDSLQGTLL